MIEEFELMYEDDIATNKAMGQFGAQHILENTGKSKVNILTHCNTGSLATAGHGTALGKPLMFCVLSHCNTGSLATAGHGTALGKPLMFCVLSHCNTGSLATAGHGTALGKPLCQHNHMHVQVPTRKRKGCVLTMVL